MKRFAAVILFLVAATTLHSQIVETAKVKQIDMPAKMEGKVGTPFELEVKTLLADNSWRVWPEDHVRVNQLFSDNISKPKFLLTPLKPGKFLFMFFGARDNKASEAFCEVTVEGGDLPPIKTQKYFTGRVQVSDEVLRKRHEEMRQRHGGKMGQYSASVADTLPDSFDCGETQGIGDQMSCGYCHGYSAADGASIAMAFKGVIPVNDRLSNQFGLDCYPNGGCGGGDEYDTLDDIKKLGFPLLSAYYPYVGRSQGCRASKGQRYKIDDFGYCTPNQQQGIASTLDMKAAIYKYKTPISIAFCADGCQGYTGGIMRGRGGQVDHAVLCCGWKTVNGKTIFKGRNQWSDQWGEGGFFWIEEGSYSWGTEAMWILVNGSGPTPPDPVPVPGAAPVITSAKTANATIGQPFVYQIVATNAPTAFYAFGLPDGFACDLKTGAIVGTSVKAGVSTVTMFALNASGAGTDKLMLTVSAAPVGVTITLSGDLPKGTYKIVPATGEPPLIPKKAPPPAKKEPAKKVDAANPNGLTPPELAVRDKLKKAVLVYSGSDPGWTFDWPGVAFERRQDKEGAWKNLPVVALYDANDNLLQVSPHLEGIGDMWAWAGRYLTK